ncbi:hypothetical protein EHQ13_15940 [Leptospira gomenensis]|nr:hypothetical protein EHQ13_15940 [Leptospira gomenensis]
MSKFVNEDPRNLFLIDGSGAAFSGFACAVVLAGFENFFGIPSRVAYALSVAAFSFSVYSSFCYLLKPESWRIFLKTIATANLSYCAVTAFVLFYYRDTITFYGAAYFVSEKIVVAFLAFQEFRVSRLGRSNG